MSKIVMGQSTPHWAQRVGDFLGNMGAQQRQQRQVEEQQKQQMMQQEIERARKFVASAPDKQMALQQVPEALRPFVSMEATEFPKDQLQLAQEQAAMAEAQQKAAAAGAKTSDISSGSPTLRNAGVGYSDKVIEMAGDEAFLATLPPEVAQKIKLVAAKVAPDANTVLNSEHYAELGHHSARSGCAGSGCEHQPGRGQFQAYLPERGCIVGGLPLPRSRRGWRSGWREDG
jgi:hypothetical protein